MSSRIDVLSRQQENEIWAAIDAVGLKQPDFEWTARAGSKYEASTYHRLTHKPTGSYLEFSLWSADGHYVSWRPMFPSGDRSHGAKHWREAQSIIATWLTLVRAEDEAPDLWGSLSAQQAIPNAADHATASQPFSAGELKLLDEGLADIESYVVTTQPLDPDARDQVKRRFAYLREAARTGVRKIRLA